MKRDTEAKTYKIQVVQSLAFIETELERIVDQDHICLLDLHTAIHGSIFGHNSGVGVVGNKHLGLNICPPWWRFISDELGGFLGNPHNHLDSSIGKGAIVNMIGIFVLSTS
jgi:hypothetical protein